MCNFGPSAIGTGGVLCITFTTFYVFGVTCRIFVPCLVVCLRGALKVRGCTVPLNTVLIISTIVSILLNNIVSGINGIGFLLPTTVVLATNFILVCFIGNRGVTLLVVVNVVVVDTFLIASTTIYNAVESCAPGSGINLFRNIQVIFRILVPVVANPCVNTTIVTGGGRACRRLNIIGAVPAPGVFLTTTTITIFSLVPVTILLRDQHGTRTTSAR